MQYKRYDFVISYNMELDRLWNVTMNTYILFNNEYDIPYLILHLPSSQVNVQKRGYFSCIFFQ